MTVTLDKPAYKSGDTVKAEITSSGEVGVENSIASLSKVLKGSGKRTVNLGTIPKIGFYSLLFKDATGAREIQLLVLDTAEVPKPKEAKSTKPEAVATMNKVYNGFTTAFLKEAWKTYPGKQKMAENAVGITTGMSFGIVCAYGFAPGCAISADFVKGVVLDFGAEFYVQMARVQQAKGYLTAAELAVVEAEISLNKILLGVLGSTGMKELAGVAEGAAEKLLDDVVTDPAGKVGVSVTRDSAKKIYMILKKLP
ncbi:MAG TPA: hypothetical protein DCP71_09635 [Verrucomicrobiales bacterium]|nr:hypothetical protein [Verrucomicrobiales bacterium]